MKHRDDHIRWGNAFVLTYSVCNRDTFRPIEGQIRYLQRCKAPCSVPITIVANMVDLEHRREVNLEEGRDLAEEYGCHFFEVSAAEGSMDVREAFLTILRELHESKKTSVQIKRRRSSVTRNVANKVMQAVFGGSPRRSRKISLPWLAGRKVHVTVETSMTIYRLIDRLIIHVIIMGTSRGCHMRIAWTLCDIDNNHQRSAYEICSRKWSSDVLWSALV